MLIPTHSADRAVEAEEMWVRPVILDPLGDARIPPRARDEFEAVSDDVDAVRLMNVGVGRLPLLGLRPLRSRFVFLITRLPCLRSSCPWRWPIAGAVSDSPAQACVAKTYRLHKNYSLHLSPQLEAHWKK